MPQENRSVLALNRGILSTLAAARTDLARAAMAAEVMTNWMPRVLGSMMLRPGWQYLGTTAGNAVSKTIPFVFATNVTAEIEITAASIRIWIDDELVSRPTVTAAVTNGNFTSDLSGWTDNDESGAASAWASGGYLSLTGTGPNAAILDQQVTVNQANVEHALRIVIARGPVVLRVGSTSGGEEYVSETTLGTGTHSLAFTPTGNFHIRVQNRRQTASLVDSINVEAAGIMTLPSAWAAGDLSLIRRFQSADVVYLACAGYQQRKLERRAARSWSIVLYQPENGPFRVSNVSAITLTPSALTGDITLTASKPLFRSTHVGALFRLSSTGQTVTAELSGADQFTDPIRITGIDAQRGFQLTITGTWTATVTLQYSVGEPGSWVDVVDYTANQSLTYDDTLDNQIIYYRIGIKSGDYGTGSATATLAFASGSATGVVRITAFSSDVSVSAAVLDSLGGTGATSDWAEGSWSDRRGWPSAVMLHDGRLSWFGSSVFSSVSDDYENFDDSVEGDSAPIQRGIGKGPVDTINWALSLLRLLIGTDGAEISIRASSLDEPLTQTGFGLRSVSSQGSAQIEAVEADTSGFFVQRAGQRLFELLWDADKNDYRSEDVTLLVPDLNAAGIVHIAVQRQPDLRVHCVRADGTVGVMVQDRAENVICWLEVETSGVVEDVCVRPGAGEDAVTYTVRRTIGGTAVRYREKWAAESECTGFPEAFHADAHVRYSGAETTSITGLSHLEGEDVVIWGWNTVTPFTDQEGNAIGRDFGVRTVMAGQITGLAASVTDACVGLGYSAPWKSMKQSFAAALGTALNQRKRIGQVGLILKNCHGQGVKYGPNFETDLLQDIPQDDLPTDDADAPDLNHIFSEHEMDMAPFDGTWEVDTRFCLLAAAPRPVTVLACTVQLQTSG
jgi:hypothetical protein